MKFKILLVLLISSVFAISQTKTSSKASKDHFVNKYPNGKLEAEGDYYNGKQHGAWKFWYANGNIKQTCTYNFGRLHGKVTVYYTNGKKEDEGEFKVGQRHGKYTGWYTNGNIRIQGQYSRDDRPT